MITSNRDNRAFLHEHEEGIGYQYKECGLAILRTTLAHVCLRRTKDVVQDKIELTNKEVQRLLVTYLTIFPIGLRDVPSKDVSADTLKPHLIEQPIEIQSP